MRNEFSYVGLLRNEKKFNINDDVFVGYEHTGMFRGKIVGVELPPKDNPEYRYKVQIPKELCQELQDGTFDSLICDNIFNSIEEAKQSTIKNLERMTELQREEIDRYFDRFEE